MLCICLSSFRSISFFRDVMIVTTLDTFTSLMAGCTIFGILGNLAHELGTEDISKVVRGGTGLAFISYPDALSRFEFTPQLFAVLFFIMLFVLGIGSAVALCGAVLNVCRDHLPKVRQWLLVLCVTCFGFVVSLVYVTPVRSTFRLSLSLSLSLFQVFLVRFRSKSLLNLDITSCNDVEYGY